MTISSSADARIGEPVRARHGHKRRAVLLVALGLIAIGSFVIWGPVGIGSGPLSAAIGGMDAGVHSGRGPVGFIIPIRNAGNSPAVVDGIDLSGGTSYPAPQVLKLEVVTSGGCGGIWPARQTGRGFMPAGCGGTTAGALIGHAFGRTPAFGLPVAIEVAAPRRGTCWVMTKIVVHYHVGIRHFSASDPRYQLIVCASSAQLQSAEDAAAASAG